jgi:hypothetical protein
VSMSNRLSKDFSSSAALKSLSAGPRGECSPQTSVRDPTLPPTPKLEAGSDVGPTEDDAQASSLA